MEFGKKMGIVDHQEFETMERMSDEMMHNGPGGCQSPQECKTYCDNPKNMEECIKFSEKMGLMKPAEADVIRMLRPEGPGGPGGCQDKEKCKEYCMNPEHIEECLDFFLEQKIMLPEDADRMREIREMAPPMQMMPRDDMMPDDMMEHRDDMMFGNERHPIMMPDNMIPFDIENMPLEKIMELLPPDMREKLESLPPEEIKKAITTYKMETMLLPERDMPMMEPGIPMEYEPRTGFQIQTQMQMPMIMPDNMMPNDDMMLWQDKMPMLMPDNMMPDQQYIMPHHEIMPGEIMNDEYKMPMIMPDNMILRDEVIIDNKIIENEMPMIQPYLEVQNFYDTEFIEPMRQIDSMEPTEPMEQMEPKPEPQTFLNIKQFLANIVGVFNGVINY
jgi:hypothetical protein